MALACSCCTDYLNNNNNSQEAKEEKISSNNVLEDDEEEDKRSDYNELHLDVKLLYVKETVLDLGVYLEYNWQCCNRGLHGTTVMSNLVVCLFYHFFLFQITLDMYFNLSLIEHFK